MGLFKIIMEHIWSKPFKDAVHNAAIGNLVGDIQPEIMGSSFDHTLKAFDIGGTLKFETEFPAEITQFMCEPITSANAIELISGDINGNVRLMSKKGKFIWATNVSSAIVSMDLGDVTGDGKLEIIVGMENHHIALINHRGEKLFEGDAPHPIIDVSLGLMNLPNKETMIALSRNGDVYTIDFANQWQKLLHLEGDPTCFTFFDFQGIKGFLVGYQNGDIRAVDISGRMIGEYSIGIRINDIDKESIKVDNVTNLYMVIASGNDLHLFQLIKGEPIKDAPIEKKLLESPPIVFNTPFPVQTTILDPNTTSNRVSKSKKTNEKTTQIPASAINTTTSEQTSGAPKENKRLKCPECKNYLPIDFELKIMKGFDVFCESCGCLLRKDSLSIMKL